MATEKHKVQPQAPPEGTTTPPAAPAPAGTEPVQGGARAGAEPIDAEPGPDAPGSTEAEPEPEPEPQARAAEHGSGEPEPDPEPAAEPQPELDEAALRERAGKADEYLGLAQRTQADFENFRKRMVRDVKAAEARGMLRLARELLPALDNLERALAAVESSDSDSDHHLTEGIRLVQSELASALQRTGIEGYATKGERFDPVHHEAVAQTAVEGAEPGTIVEVLQAGYRLNDSIVRPARVIVAG